MESSPYYFHMKTKILAEFQICISVPLRKWKPTLVSEWDKFLNLFVFFVNGKLITKAYMSQNKLQFFLAYTTYRALLRQLRARTVYDSNRARILFQPV